MPPKRNLKPAVWRRNFTSGSSFDNHPSVIIVQNFKKITQRTAELLRFNLSLHIFKPTIVNGTTTQCRMHTIVNSIQSYTVALNTRYITSYCFLHLTFKLMSNCSCRPNCKSADQNPRC